MESDEGVNLCVSVININYQPLNPRQRKGGIGDKELLLFSELFGFTPHREVADDGNNKEHIFKDCSKEQLESLFQCVVEKLKDKQYKRVSVFISAHGRERLVCKVIGSYVMEHFIECIVERGKPPEFYPTTVLLDMFNIGDLAHVTKIFTIQTCRSSNWNLKEEEEDYGVSIQLVETSDDEIETPSGQSSQQRKESLSKVDELQKRVYSINKMNTEKEQEPKYEFENPNSTSDGQFKASVTFNAKVGYVGQIAGKEKAEETAIELAFNDLGISDDKSNKAEQLKKWCEEKDYPAPDCKLYGSCDRQTCIVTVTKEFQFTGLEMSSRDEAKESAAACALINMNFGSAPLCIPNSVVAFASPCGKLSYSSINVVEEGLEDGGWLPVALYKEAEQLQGQQEDVDLLDLFTKANSRMAQREDQERKVKLTLKAAGSFNHQLKDKVILKFKKEEQNL